MRILKATAIAAALACAGAGAAQADQLIGSYYAYIGQDDLYNSSGRRLTAPWQVLRQDRANFHRFGIAQSGDEWDPFFGDMENRGIMERMVRDGSMSSAAARDIMRGGAMVYVEIRGHGNRGQRVVVSVAR